jgi:hypothetical protein
VVYIGPARFWASGPNGPALVVQHLGRGEICREDASVALRKEAFSSN